jgi:probable selenium-dependent hydroxylase accessory protein YqeC
LDLWNLDSADYLIIEADGAAGRPVKAPREGEPVIPSNTTLVVAMLGVDGAGKELNDENVFQAELISTMTGIPLGRPLTEEALSILVTHLQGIFKGTPSFSRVIVFLNKVDLSEGVQKAERIAEKILEKKNRQIERVVLGQLKKDPPVVEVMFP